MEKQSSKEQEVGNSQATKLRPIVYTAESFRNKSAGKGQELLLLKALQVTTDPKELRRMIGVRAVADVYKTLDKMAMRKEYHRALSENGISFDYIVKNMKLIIDSAEKDGDKLKALQTLLRSVGVDTYQEENKSTGGSWEEALLKATESLPAKEDPVALESGEYVVKQPKVPEYIKKMQDEEKKLSQGIYD
jgi:hypothetical protein